jgi:hypothetical protein
MNNLHVPGLLTTKRCLRVPKRLLQLPRSPHYDPIRLATIIISHAQVWQLTRDVLVEQSVVSRFPDDCRINERCILLRSDQWVYERQFLELLCGIISETYLTCTEINLSGIVGVDVVALEERDLRNL